MTTTLVKPPEPRDVYILDLLRRGKTYIQVGRHLGLSEGAVNQKVYRLRRTYRCPNKSALVALAIEQGWIK